MNLNHFAEVWCCDFEFHAPDGERPSPICMVAKEWRSGRIIRHWAGGFSPRPPFRIDADALFVSYYASAELGCFIALGWPMPARVLDLFVEFRNLTNGLPTSAGSGLLGALVHHGLDTITAAQKDAGRDLAIRGGPFTADERQRLLDYCESDVNSLCRLLSAMESKIDIPRALLRGRYMAAAARIEWSGIPIDVETLSALRDRWDNIKAALIREIDKQYGVFDGSTFKRDQFERYLAERGIPWPRLPSGQLDLSDDTFRERSKADPRIAPLHELRTSLAQLRLNKLAVGSDGRNRTLLSSFRSRTGRNQPSNARFIFGPATWLRSLIAPPPGRAVAYLDWAAQEIGIAAALSGDQALLDSYLSGDPYLSFAIRAGGAPPDATKDSHGDVREQYKQVLLGVGYGMEEATLAQRLGIMEIEARDLLLRHRLTYPKFWRWSNGYVDSTILSLQTRTNFGWTLHIGTDVNPRSVGNFPMQAHGAEMLRLACMLGTERGIQICAPVHDAIMIEAPIDDIKHDVDIMQAIMRKASRIVLPGFELRTDDKPTIIKSPHRYMDKRGAVMWRRVMELLDQCEAARAVVV